MSSHSVWHTECTKKADIVTLPVSLLALGTRSTELDADSCPSATHGLAERSLGRRLGLSVLTPLF